MNYPIVMFVGKLGSGKDTAAQFMRDRVKKAGVITLAAPMKEFAKKVFGFTHDQMYGSSALREQVFTKDNHSAIEDFKRYAPAFIEDLFSKDLQSNGEALDKWFWSIIDDGPRTGRHILQTLGTEFGRAQDQDVWIRAGINGATQALVEGADLVTFTDGRFRNEVLAIKRVGGMIVNVIDPDNRTVAVHASEKEQESIPEFWYDYRLVNRKGMGLLNLKHLVDSIPL